MTELGYTLSSEEFGPNELVDLAMRAEGAGFAFSLISDHYHPWIERQGESAFVWSALGGIARATDELRVGTGVTCPIVRIHPAIIAQAAATTAAMFEGRFFLGVGTGERLNEHVLGDRWPPHSTRLSMLEEAVEVMRALWRGTEYSHNGEHFTVENAKLYTLPEEPPDIYVAAGGEETAAAAGRIGDGLISTSPDEAVVESFADAHEEDAPRYAQVTVCWAETDDDARQTVHEWWPNSALPGEVGQELATPAHFEQATEIVTEEQATEHVPCGPDPNRHVEALGEFVDAGFDHVYVHQIGPQQEEAIEFYREEVLPSFDFD